MNNIFFLTRDSFQEGTQTFEELEDTVHRLSKQIETIKDINGNQVFVCEDIYEHWEWQGHSIHEIWDPECGLERDLKARIQTLIEKNASSASSISTFGLTDEGKCYGLLTVSIRQEYDDIWQVDGNEHTWYEFCLNAIRYSSINSHDFLDDCKILFGNIEFLERNYKTIDDIYSDFKNRILHHLNGLNKHMRTALHYAKNRNDALVILSDLGNFDEKASTEGNAKRKDDFTFSVDKGNGEICCEPHIKLSKSDIDGDSQYYYHRIYFHEGDKSLFDGRIIVGHIGKHL